MSTRKNIDGEEVAEGHMGAYYYFSLFCVKSTFPCNVKMLTLL
jgi:hypothetical protein